jgi:hypothetical protein
MAGIDEKEEFEQSHYSTNNNSRNGEIVVGD